MLHPCMVSLKSLLKRAFSFPFFIDLNWKKNASVMDAARPPLNNVFEKILVVHNSVHNEAVITLLIHVVGMINYRSNIIGMCVPCIAPAHIGNCDLFF